MVNPYLPPKVQTYAAAAPAAAPASEHEEVRRAHIKAEANIKSAGNLFLFFGIVGAIALVLNFDEFAVNIELILTFVFYFVCGFLLRNLKPAGRILYALAYAWMVVGNIIGYEDIAALFDGPAGPNRAGIVVGLFIGLAIPTWILYSLFSNKAKTVFSEHYREVVVPATPHVKYRSKLLWWVLGICLVLAVCGGILAANA